MSRRFRNGRFPERRTIAQWKERASARLTKLRAAGREVHPVEIEGRTISKTFWGKAWCANLEAYSDYENRLPRGRAYVRHNSVLDLRVSAPKPEQGVPTGRIEALVDGNRIFEVKLKVVPLAADKWQAIKDACAGEIDSLIELLQGKLSDSVLEIVTQPESGLFPSAEEIDLNCTCPDWASMCKHVAASLYALGARLDSCPELLFQLRGVDPRELIDGAIEHNAREAAPCARPTVGLDALRAIFGSSINFDKIDLNQGAEPVLKSTLSKSMRVAGPAKVRAPLPSLPPRANRLLALIKAEPGLCTPALIKGIRSRRYATTKALALLKLHELVEFRGSPRSGGYFFIERH